MRTIRLKFRRISSALIFTLSTATLPVYIQMRNNKMSETEFTALNANVGKKILKKGRLGRKPSVGWTCNITVSNESENSKENLEITIGNACSTKDRIIEFCVESMYLDEESVFSINLEKENEVLLINIVLTGVQEKPYIFQWTDEEKLETSNYYKLKGTELFKNNNIEEAFYKFGAALKFTLLLDSVLEADETNEEIRNLRTALYNNLAGCQLHFKNYTSVTKLCEKSLELHPTPKAYYRRALANIELKEYEKAELDLMQLLKLEPRNKAALDKYKLVRELDKSNRDNYESIVKKMFR